MPLFANTKSILFICPFPEGVAAGQRLKYEQAFQYFADNNYTIEVSSFMDLKMWDIVYKDGFLFSKILGTFKGHFRRLFWLTKLRQYDLVYIFMWVTPMGSSLMESLYLKLSRKTIYDIEDNIFLEGSNSINPLMKFLRGNNKTIFLVKNANHIITSSPYLNNYCLDIHKHRKCTFVSSSIETSRYVKGGADKAKVTIGWTGTFSSRRYLDLLRDVLKNVKQKRDFKLIVIGNFDYEFPEMDLEVIQWTKENEIKDLQKIDIGLYPLVKEDWVLGKSGLKALQYMGMSIPAVATNFGTACDFIDNGVNGFLVDNDKEWEDCLIKLIDNPCLRKKVGEAARKTVDNKYAVEVIKEQYLNIIKETI